ncbi:MAG: aldo/keto reductase [Bacteroidota bacterium]
MSKELIFRNNNSMPILGLGTWKSGHGEVYKAIREAIKIGYRHIDCAPIYGNEVEIGHAFTDAFSSGDVRREELWVTSKLWNNAHEKDHVLPALKQTLKDLQLTYLDLYLVHWPIVLRQDVVFAEKGDDFLSLDTVPITETWKGMESCAEQGLSKHIGVSNFSVLKLKSLVSHSIIKPELNQIELHPFLQQKSMLGYCQNENIHLTAYSPLGSRDRIPEFKGENEPGLLEHPVIIGIAKNRKCSPAQVLIKWAMERGTAVIPKSVNPERLKQNFDAIKICLSESDLIEIADIDIYFRFIDGTFWTMEGAPYTLSNIWDE